MKRLIYEHKNSAEEYDRIFRERAKKEPAWTDMRRWEKLIAKYRGGSILDIGCLDSQIPRLVVERFPNAEVWGIDIASQAMAALKAMPMPGNVFYVVMDLYEMKFKDGEFDYAVMGEVLEHLERPKSAVEEAVRVLRPGGTLAVSVPLNEASEPGAVDAERHIWSYTIADLVSLLRPYGRVKTAVLGSRHFPRFRYAFPTAIAWLKKK